MLKTCGNISSTSQDEMETMHEALLAAGYDFAYITPQMATIVREVTTLEERNGQSENATN